MEFFHRDRNLIRPNSRLISKIKSFHLDVHPKGVIILIQNCVVLSFHFYFIVVCNKDGGKEVSGVPIFSLTSQDSVSVLINKE